MGGSFIYIWDMYESLAEAGERLCRPDVSQELIPPLRCQSREELDREDFSGRVTLNTFSCQGLVTSWQTYAVSISLTPMASLVVVLVESIPPPSWGTAAAAAAAAAAAESSGSR